MGAPVRRKGLPYTRPDVPRPAWRAAPRETGGTATVPAPGRLEQVDASRAPRPPRRGGAAAARRLLDDPDPAVPRPPRRPKVRARKVHRIVRHIEPWSVLKMSVLFFLSIFLIICVASAVLWNAARSAGAIDDVESFITSLGFGNCEDIEPDSPPPDHDPVDGRRRRRAGRAAAAPLDHASPADRRRRRRRSPTRTATAPRASAWSAASSSRTSGSSEAFALGGVVLVLAGAAASVVLALLFNLISDLTGGVRVTVLEEEPRPRRRSGSPAPADRD